MKNAIDYILGTVRSVKLTPALVHNLSVLLGIGLVTAGAAEAFGHAAGLLVAGGLVLLFTALERVLLFLRSRI